MSAIDRIISKQCGQTLEQVIDEAFCSVLHTIRSALVNAKSTQILMCDEFCAIRGLRSR